MDFEIIETILSIVEKYGLSLTILVFLVLWLKPKIDTIWKEYSVSRNTMEMTEKQKEMLSVDNILTFDLKVKALLDELKEQVNCDWVQLWQFHNGVFSMGLPHIPFLFVSITHEVTSDKVMPMSLVYRSLPTTFFKDAGTKFEKDDYVITTLTKDASDISRMFALGGLSNCLLPIRNGKGKLAALLSVGYSEPHVFSDTDLTAMKLTAQRLGIYLSTALLEASHLKSHEVDTKPIRK